MALRPPSQPSEYSAVWLSQNPRSGTFKEGALRGPAQAAQLAQAAAQLAGPLCPGGDEAQKTPAPCFAIACALSSRIGRSPTK